MRRLRMSQLRPLSACVARASAGGEWGLILWTGRTSWWAR